MARSTTLAETPSQTAGPYVHIGLLPRFAGLKRHPHQLGNGLGSADEPGERIRIEGHLLDGNGAPVGDGLIEVWQAGVGTGDATIEGAAGSGTRGWGRLVPDVDSGHWCIDTVKPRDCRAAGGQALAPHLVLWIVARGINLGLSTRVYFDDEAEANERDPVLALVDVARRATLIAKRDPADAVYRLDIHLQGDVETVFFDV